MRARQVTVVSLLVIAGIFALAVPAVGVPVEMIDDSTQENETESGEGLGTQLSSFAQSSAADARSEAESGMWEASVNTSANPEADIHSRADDLEARLSDLEQRSAHLQANRENLSAAEYNARSVGVRSEIANLRSAVDRANKTATAHGVNATKLDTLRTNAANMTGPEVAEIARNISDAPRGPPEHVDPGTENNRGQPDDVGPGNETDRGQPDDVGPGNETDRGQPDDAGPDEDRETGPSEQPGQGNNSDRGP